MRQLRPPFGISHPPGHRVIDNLEPYSPWVRGSSLLVELVPLAVVPHSRFQRPAS